MDTARPPAQAAVQPDAPVTAALSPSEWGRVTLVGAGPGDAELLTLKAARVLASARVVLYDNLVSDDVLRQIPQDAERIYVGNDLCYDMLTVIRTIEEEYNRLRLQGRA